MFFYNSEHEENFLELCFLYGDSRASDSQYRANIYIASVPEIYKLLEKNEELLSNGPLVSLMEYSEKAEDLIPSNGGLTGSTTWLLKIGMSLYNGFQCSLDNRPSNEYANVVLQALAIRYQVLTAIK